MNISLLRRYSLHPFRSRHNPITRLVLFMSLFAILLVAINAAYEIRSLYLRSEADRIALSEMFQFLRGDGKLVEVTGKYAVEHSIVTKTYEVK